MVLEIAEANFDEIKAFKQLGEGLHYTVYVRSAVCLCCLYLSYSSVCL